MTTVLSKYLEATLCPQTWNEEPLFERSGEAISAMNCCLSLRLRTCSSNQPGPWPLLSKAFGFRVSCHGWRLNPKPPEYERRDSGVCSGLRLLKLMHFMICCGQTFCGLLDDRGEHCWVQCGTKISLERILVWHGPTLVLIAAHPADAVCAVSQDHLGGSNYRVCNRG